MGQLKTPNLPKLQLHPQGKHIVGQQQKHISYKQWSPRLAIHKIKHKTDKPWLL